MTASISVMLLQFDIPVLPDSCPCNASKGRLFTCIVKDNIHLRQLVLSSSTLQNLMKISKILRPLIPCMPGSSFSCYIYRWQWTRHRCKTSAPCSCQQWNQSTRASSSSLGGKILSETPWKSSGSLRMLTTRNRSR